MDEELKTRARRRRLEFAGADRRWRCRSAALFVGQSAEQFADRSRRRRATETGQSADHISTRSTMRRPARSRAGRSSSGPATRIRRRSERASRICVASRKYATERTSEIFRNALMWRWPRLAIDVIDGAGLDDAGEKNLLFSRRLVGRRRHRSSQCGRLRRDAGRQVATRAFGPVAQRFSHSDMMALRARRACETRRRDSGGRRAERSGGAPN